MWTLNWNSTWATTDDVSQVHKNTSTDKNAYWETAWKSESDNTKFNTPAPHSHLRPCNTNESHDTGERKWLIGPNLDIFT